MGGGSRYVADTALWHPHRISAEVSAIMTVSVPRQLRKRRGRKAQFAAGARHLGRRALAAFCL
jgi:hypothetical protein